MNYDLVDELLKQRGLSRRKLAELIGISANTLSAAFRRKSKNIPVESVMKIGDVLGVNWWELMGLNDYGGGFYGKEMAPEKAKQIYTRLATAKPPSDDIDTLVNIFNKLNDAGKSECIKRIQELSEIIRYQK